MQLHKMSRFEVAISIKGAFIATLCASFFSYSILEIDGATLILASTGASAMLVFGLPQSPASQPWSLVGGHLVSAFVGVSCHFLLSNEVLASSVAIPIGNVSHALLAGQQCMSWVISS